MIALPITRRWISLRALEDREDFRVTVHALDRVVAGVAVAAKDLDGLIRHVDSGFASASLAIDPSALVKGLLLRAIPAGPPHSTDERRRSSSSCRRVSTHTAGNDELRAELFSTCCAYASDIRCRSESQGHRADRGPVCSKFSSPAAEPAAFLTFAAAGDSAASKLSWASTPMIRRPGNPNAVLEDDLGRSEEARCIRGS